MVGQYIKDRVAVDEAIFDLVRDAEGKEKKRYIIEIPKKNFRYTQYSFDWFNYLKTLPFIQTGPDGELFIVDAGKAEQERLQRLRNTASLISSGKAFLNQQGEISEDASGVKHEPHRFHYGR